jgi:hypothetical protein
VPVADAEELRDAAPAEQERVLVAFDAVSDGDADPLDELWDGERDSEGVKDSDRDAPKTVGDCDRLPEAVSRLVMLIVLLLVCSIETVGPERLPLGDPDRRDRDFVDDMDSEGGDAVRVVVVVAVAELEGEPAEKV